MVFKHAWLDRGGTLCGLAGCLLLLTLVLIQTNSERYRLRALSHPPDSPERMKNLDAAVRANPANARARAQLSAALFAGGDREAARREAAEAARAYASVEFMLQRSSLVAEPDEKGEALALLRKVLLVQPDNATAATLLAARLLNRREIAEAITVARDLYERDPDNPDAAWLLGALAQHQGKPQLARFYYDQARALLETGRPSLLRLTPESATPDETVTHAAHP